MVITVFDPAGNTDRTVWNVDVNAAQSTSGSGGLIAAGGFACRGGCDGGCASAASHAPLEQNTTPVPTAEASAEQAKAAEMASIYGSAQQESATVQPVMTHRHGHPHLQPRWIDGPVARRTSRSGPASMAGLEALVEDVEPEPVAAFEPEEATKAPAAQQEPDVPEAPATSTTSPGGRLELLAGLVDMLEERTDGPQ